ncbi:MAG: threonine synthase [Acidobacteriota bacterium]
MLASTLVELACTRCGANYDTDKLQSLCSCGGPLYAGYDLEAAASSWRCGKGLAGRPHSVWRYAEILPVRQPANRLTLGEGSTPLLEVPRTSQELGMRRLLVKDEGLNPTGSFKARGLCVAVSRALELGVGSVAIPTAGNAGGALAAYAARGGLEATVYMPADAPQEFVDECRGLGAKVVKVPGLITDAGAAMAADAEREGFFTVATLKEPYRVEGKKTMGIELAEQLDWQLPDAIIYPTGGGTGLLGMWKAFDELEALGSIDSRRPRMISVQTEGCAPIVRAFAEGTETAEPWQNAATIASGLRVPSAVADREILRVLRQSDGDAISVSDAEILDYARRLGAEEGFYVAPEAAATIAAIPLLLSQGRLDADGTVVAFLTGSAYKYRTGLMAASP